MTPGVSNFDDPDRSDMRRLCDGNDEALNELMQRHAARLFNYLLRSLHNEEDARDLAQETFSRIYFNRNKFDPSQRFIVWLYAIASNLVRDQFRYRLRHPTISLSAAPESEEGSASPYTETTASAAPNPGECVLTAETISTVQKAVADLPEELRTPLILAEYEELSHSEIGAVLKCSSKAVETRLYRARKKLRDSLSHFLGKD